MCVSPLGHVTGGGRGTELSGEVALQRSKDCEEIQKLLPSYAEGSVSSEVDEKISQHVYKGQCRPCQEALMSLMSLSF